MMQQLADGKHRAAGIRQVMKAVGLGRARAVFLASDADPEALDGLRRAARKKGLALVETATMRELGRACGIQVPCAAAALLDG